MKRVALAALVLLLSGTGVSAHDPVILDPHRATPGIRIELVEVPQAPTAASTSRRYRLIATGVPAGVTFGIWVRDFGHGFHEVLSGFRKDDLSEIILEPGPYFRGAIWDVALVSEDRAITAFTKVIPRPIVARDGGCVVTLELVSHRGQRFLASAKGFVPGDDVVVESRYAGRVQQKQHRVAADGGLPPDVITLVAPGSDRSARYSVIGRSCQVTIDFEWGEQAFQRG